MTSLQASAILVNPCYFSSKRIINRVFNNVPKLLPPRRISLSIIPKASLVQESDRSTDIKIQKDNDKHINLTNSKAIMELYAVLEAIADKIEMHNNVSLQRDNRNTLLLNSIHMITLTASTMAGFAITCEDDAPLLALKLSSSILFFAATGMLLVVNKIQPSQLAEEQRNATRLFKQLHNQIQTKIAVGNPSEEDVKDAMEKVLALDKAYPLPLLGGAMIDKFPAKFEGANWWPNSPHRSPTSDKSQNYKHLISHLSCNSKCSLDLCQKIKNRNGWNEEFEKEMREIIEVVKRKDKEDYERLGNLALKINKSLAIAGPLLTGIAALGSAFGSWGTIVPVLAGALATVVNAFEHGGQVGMFFEMYRNCAGFFQLLEENIEMTIEENDLENRENGEVFEMKMALQLGRSLSQLRELASKSASYKIQGREIDEFASKLF